MAYLDLKELKSLYTESKQEAKVWREDYPAFERLADNGLLDGLDPNLPEVNDGSLAAALYKLPKRVVSSKLSGTVRALDRDEAWLSELANLQWQNEIIPNATMQAPFTRKWKDAVRKAAIYGSVPIINLFVSRDGVDRSDFIVAQPQDVTLEAGKVSDSDSDVIFWDVYYSKSQVEDLLAEAKANEHPDTKWSPETLQKILDGNYKEEREPQDQPKKNKDNNTRPKGFKFQVAFQRGIEAPFMMYHAAFPECVREWTNPDPTGDIPVHYLYCYQDLINPYGTGICKLAGGTQNVLDYMRKADVLATQMGLAPPIMVRGDEESVDVASMVYTENALWFVGQTEVERMELSSGVYSQLPGRMAQYQASLQKLIPTGDTSMSGSDSGDQTQSKTPAGVKLAAANLSIDDEDFKDNLYITYRAVAKSMINSHFANMEGEDMMKLSDDERELLMKAGLEFPENEDGELSNEVQMVWDDLRASFDFEVDPEQDKAKDDADKLEGLTKVFELTMADPMLEQTLALAGKKFNKGELLAEIIALTSDNDKIITDIIGEEQADQAAAMQGIDPATGMPIEQPVEEAPPMEAPVEDVPQEMPMEQPQPQAPAPSEEEIQANVSALMERYNVDENTALTALAAEHAGLPIEDIMAKLQSFSQEQPV